MTIVASKTKAFFQSSLNSQPHSQSSKEMVQNMTILITFTLILLLFPNSSTSFHINHYSSRNTDYCQLSTSLTHRGQLKGKVRGMISQPNYKYNTKYVSCYAQGDAHTNAMYGSGVFDGNNLRNKMRTTSRSTSRSTTTTTTTRNTKTLLQAVPNNNNNNKRPTTKKTKRYYKQISYNR
jgi:hypothetical protein